MAFEFAPGSNSSVRLRESIVAGDVPAATELDEGELAVNTADGTLYCRDVAGAVKSFPSAAGFTQIVTLTESAYTALDPKVATTLYVVTPDPAP
jgi:hypothetical protein